jgi:hypothetical protein
MLVELVCDRLLDDDPLRRDARLAGVLKAATSGPGRRVLQVRVGEYDERVAPPELQDALLQGLARPSRYGPPRARRSSERDARDATVGDQS